MATYTTETTHTLTLTDTELGAFRRALRVALDTEEGSDAERMLWLTIATQVRPPSLFDEVFATNVVGTVVPKPKPGGSDE